MNSDLIKKVCICPQQLNSYFYIPSFDIYTQDEKKMEAQYIYNVQPFSSQT